MKVTLFILIVMSSAIGYSDDGRSFDRYRSIIDRQMFGQPPDDFDPTKPPSEVSKNRKKTEKELTKEQEQIKSSVHFSVINVNPEGETVVGFTDKSDSKSPRHYYLKVGETRDGWKVVAADAVKAWMKVVKDDVEIELTLGGDSSKGGSASRGGVPMAVDAGGGSSARNRSRLLGDSLRNRRFLRQKLEEQEKLRLESEKKQMEETRQEIREQLMLLTEEARNAKEIANKAAAAAEARGKEEGNAENNAEPVQE